MLLHLEKHTLNFRDAVFFFAALPCNEGANDKRLPVSPLLPLRIPATNPTCSAGLSVSLSLARYAALAQHSALRTRRVPTSSGTGVRKAFSPPRIFCAESYARDKEFYL